MEMVQGIHGLYQDECHQAQGPFPLVRLGLLVACPMPIPYQWASLL